MKFNIYCLFAAFTATFLGLSSCVTINEELGGNFIPTDQTWSVYPCDPVLLKDITIRKAENLTGYSTSRITFGSIKDGKFSSKKASSFTLVPLMDTLDFGTDTKVLQFHFTASRDTLSTINDRDVKMLQNVLVRPLKKALDSTILYASDNNLLNEFVDMGRTITAGIPVYNGGDSLSFDFSEEYALEVIEGIKQWQSLQKPERDSLKYYLEKVPGIYIETDGQSDEGGRINMFHLPMATSDGYIDANYAELKIHANYNGRETDTLFVFYFGPSEFIKEGATSYPSQYAFNSSENLVDEAFIQEWKSQEAPAELFVEGGSGFKPVVKAAEIKELVSGLIEDKAKEKREEIDPSTVVINKATIILPYNVGSDYESLSRYPQVLSPTVRLVSDDEKYVTYAGLTDSSIESENQGNINLSLSRYQPDLSHHIQEIVKLKRGSGEDVDPNESEEEFIKRLEKYDIWFLIMHEETQTSSSSGSAYDDYYNSLMYNSYYNNMMYDPYGYGYGYGGYGYGGYGGYGDYYGYNNYYNYYMMAAYANASSSSSTTTSSMELDRDRFYNARLNGPGATSDKPCLKITFSAPKKAE